MKDPLVFCGNCQRALALGAEAATDSRWAKKDLAVRIASDLPGILRSVFTAECKRALDAWSAAADLRFTIVEGGAADITITTGPIDGPGGTLAWSELAAGLRALQQKYDTAERWEVSIDLYLVILHELGHALGLQHDVQNAQAVMAPRYNGSLSKLQPRDVARIQALYGAPRVDPTPPPDGGNGPNGGRFARVSVVVEQVPLRVRVFDANGAEGKVTWPS